MRPKLVILSILLVALFVLLQGCMTVALVGAGAGTVMYTMGDLEAVLPTDISTAYEAAQKSLVQLELNISSKAKDALAAEIIARDAQDKKVTIKLKSTSQYATELNIRVGVFGDEDKSRLIYEQIQKNLK